MSVLKLQADLLLKKGKCKYNKKIPPALGNEDGRNFLFL